MCVYQPPALFLALTRFASTKSIKCASAVHSLSREGKADNSNRQRHAANYTTLVADGALTIAHELAHCFMGFLTGDPGVRTPQELAPPGYEPKAGSGAESGWTWEHMVLGGCASVLGGCIAFLVPKERGDKPPPAFIQLERDGRVMKVDPGVVEALVERRTSATQSVLFPFPFFFVLFFSLCVSKLPGLTAFKQGFTFP